MCHADASPSSAVGQKLAAARRSLQSPVIGSTELWNTEIAKHIWEPLTYMATIPIPTAAKCKQVQKQNLTSLIHSQETETKSKLQTHD